MNDIVHVMKVVMVGVNVEVTILHHESLLKSSLRTMLDKL